MTIIFFIIPAGFGVLEISGKEGHFQGITLEIAKPIILEFLLISNAFRLEDITATTLALLIGHALGVPRAPIALSKHHSPPLLDIPF